MKKWVTATQHGMGANAIQKVNADVVSIAESLGYQALPITRYDATSEAPELMRVRIQGLITAVQPGDLVVCLHPILNGFIFDVSLVSALKERGAKVVINVFDTEKLRYPKDLGESYDQIGKEHALFNQADYLIVHNEAMEAGLREVGVTVPMLKRGPFDYLMPAEEAKLSDNLERKLTFVGSFDKSPFLKTWAYQTPLSAFGSRQTAEGEYPLGPNVDYLGMANFLQDMPRDAFGIFWDEGFNYQVYSQYTSPHKVALYMATGLPVIVWDGAGIAPFIKREGLGYTVKSLDEIDGLLASITDEELRALKERTNYFSYFIRDGAFTRRVLSELEGRLAIK
ncbi:hypothetical protein [Lactococcus termiticola]|uniref:Beta-1,6-galactofuranosyltransferase n=1 Tax=Lactococcus termiticola TaxID=2169526 RepID=A0A2R5HIQ2_9LACT|nr:hypothetical protein [Lactococcus termiticola]GBG97505.1 beta-1,6-galactofuranosyltransferase [Lactococcus termiticola]